MANERSFIVKCKKDNWQEKIFEKYNEVIAYLARFGIAAPAPKHQNKKAWMKNTTEYKIKYIFLKRRIENG